VPRLSIVGSRARTVRTLRIWSRRLSVHGAVSYHTSDLFMPSVSSSPQPNLSQVVVCFVVGGRILCRRGFNVPPEMNTAARSSIGCRRNHGSRSCPQSCGWIAQTPDYSLRNTAVIAGADTRISAVAYSRECWFVRSKSGGQTLSMQMEFRPTRGYNLALID